MPSTAPPAAVRPLSLARAMAAAGGAAEGTAAFLVLEAAKPWSRKTHKYFPAPARARAAELLRVGQWFKRLPSDFPIQFEVWEMFVMPHVFTRDFRGLYYEAARGALRGGVLREPEDDPYPYWRPLGAK